MAKTVDGKSPAGQSETAAKAVWRAQFETGKKLPGANDRTISNHPLKPMYGPEDLSGIEYDRDLSYPGQYPYTRGLHPTGYRGRLWTMRQFAGFGTAKQTNERYKFLLAQGQTGLSVAFDSGKNIANVAKHGVDMGRGRLRLRNGCDVDRYTQELRGNACHSYRFHRQSSACFGFHHARPKVAGHQLAQSKSQRKRRLSWQKIKDRDMSVQKIGTLLIRRH